MTFQTREILGLQQKFGSVVLLWTPHHQPGDNTTVTRYIPIHIKYPHQWFSQNMHTFWCNVRLWDVKWKEFLHTILNYRCLRPKLSVTHDVISLSLHHVISFNRNWKPIQKVPKELPLLHKPEVQSPCYMVCICKSSTCMVLQTAYRLNGGSYSQREQSSWKRMFQPTPFFHLNNERYQVKATGFQLITASLLKCLSCFRSVLANTAHDNRLGSGYCLYSVNRSIHC